MHFDGILRSNGDRTTLEEQRWRVGPTVEVSLPARFAVGVDALYRHLQDRTATIFAYTMNDTAVWEVPLYVKYRFSAGPIRPFATGGLALNHASESGSYGCSAPPLCGSGTSESSSWGRGYHMGGGVEFKIGVLKIAPEFRYTHWYTGYFSGGGAIASYRDQPVLLLGVRF